MRRRQSPSSIQRWLESVSTWQFSNNRNTCLEVPDAKTSSGATTQMADQESTSQVPVTSQASCVHPAIEQIRGSRSSNAILSRDGSFVSEASSYGSSVESLLEARRPDPEEVLVNLGFCSANVQDDFSRIPKRFLHPSEAKGIDISNYLKEQKSREAASKVFSWTNSRFRASSLNLGKDFQYGSTLTNDNTQNASNRYSQ